MIPDPAAADRRRGGRARRLPGDAACVVCGIDDPRVIHLHHPITREVDEAAVGPRCLNPGLLTW